MPEPTRNEMGEGLGIGGRRRLSGHLPAQFQTGLETLFEIGLGGISQPVGNKASPDMRCGLLSAKGGLMMGTKKVGAFSSPRKKAKIIIT
jgi:hypothetical protein